MLTKIREGIKLLAFFLTFGMATVAEFGQVRMSTTIPPVHPGMMELMKEVVTRVNYNPATAQVATYTVTADVNSQLHTLEINAVAITFTSDASGTQAEIAIGITAAVNAEGRVNGIVSAASGATTITVTARRAGVGFTATESDTNLTLAQTTANDEADPIKFGVAVARDGTSATRVQKLSVADSLTDKVYTIIPVEENTIAYRVSITWVATGLTYDSEFVSDGSGTVAEIVTGMVAAINAAVPASTVLAADGTTEMTLTSEVEGADFVVAVGSPSNTAMPASVLVATTVGDTTDLQRAITGLSVWHNLEANSSGEAEYPALSAMSVAKEGTMVVRTPSIITIGQDVYVGISSTLDHLWTGAATTSYLLLPRHQFEWVRALSATRALLRFRL